MNGYNDSAIMQKYPGLEQSLQAWRFRHNVYNDVCQKQQDAPKLQPQGSLAAPTAAAASVTTKPQHSRSENIFRKRTVSLQLFDAGEPFISQNDDGDTVDVYFNGVRIRKNFQLLPWPGTTLTLTLQPSDVLAAKTNRLYFKAVGTGYWWEPTASVGVNVAPKYAGKLFRHASATNIRVYPEAIRYFLELGQTSPALNLAVGLMCYDHRRWPQSTTHVRRAQAGIPDSKGRRHPERIVTRDSKSPAAVERVKARTRLSLNPKLYPPKSGLDRDEYPPKVFSENNGTAHIQYMNRNDNRQSGGYLGRLLTPYNDGDQIELVDALIDSPLEGALFCRDAYAQ